jgi:hypothetical protein
MMVAECCFGRLRLGPYDPGSGCLIPLQRSAESVRLLALRVPAERFRQGTRSELTRSTPSPNDASASARLF